MREVREHYSSRTMTYHRFTRWYDNGTLDWFALGDFGPINRTSICACRSRVGLLGGRLEHAC